MAEITLGVDEVTLLSDEALEKLVKAGGEYYYKITGLELSTKEPGLGSMLAAAIRGIEKAITTAFEPFIAMINMIQQAMPPSPDKLIEFIKKAIELIKGLGQLLEGAPESLIDFAISKILGPVKKEMFIPLPSSADLFKMVTGDIKFDEVDWAAKLENGEMIIPPKLQEGLDKGETWATKHIADVLSVKKFLPKIVEFVLTPLKTAIKMLEEIIKMVIDFVKSLPSAIQALFKFVSDPMGAILELLGLALKPVLEAIIDSYNAKKEDFEHLDKEINLPIDELLEKMFNGDFLNPDILSEYMKEHPELGPAFGPIIFFNTFFTTFEKVIQPQIILPAFLPFDIKDFTNITEELKGIVVEPTQEAIDGAKQMIEDGEITLSEGVSLGGD